MLRQLGKDLTEATPEARPRGGLGARRGMLMMLFHLLSLFRLLACPAGQERAAAAGCPRPAGPARPGSRSGWMCRQCGGFQS